MDKHDADVVDISDEIERVSEPHKAGLSHRCAH
jgi:hypothetical protein